MVVTCIAEKARARIPAASSSFCHFFAPPYSLRRCARVSRSAGGAGQPMSTIHPRVILKALIEGPPGHRRPAPGEADLRLCPRREHKSVVSRSARRLASSDATPAVLAGAENGLYAADGPLPWPRTRDGVRGATRSRYHHGLPVASRAPRPRRCDFPAPRTTWRPPTARPRGHGPETASAARRRCP